MHHPGYGRKGKRRSVTNLSINLGVTPNNQPAREAITNADLFTM